MKRFVRKDHVRLAGAALLAYALSVLVNAGEDLMVLIGIVCITPVLRDVLREEVKEPTDEARSTDSR